jgi:hypothetical protein
MTPEETIRLAAVDVRERPEEDDALADALASIQRDELRITILQESVSILMFDLDNARARIRQLDAFLAKHPQPAKEQVE